MVLVEQNLPLVRRIASAAVVIDGGRVVHASDAATLLADEDLVNELFGVAAGDLEPARRVRSAVRPAPEAGAPQ